MWRWDQRKDVTPRGFRSSGTLRGSCKGALERGHLSMGAVLGEPGGGCPLLGALKVTK